MELILWQEAGKNLSLSKRNLWHRHIAWVCNLPLLMHKWAERWQGSPWHAPGLGAGTHHTGTGSTACSLPPSPRTCPRPSACRCRSWQRRPPPTPPGTCTPARCCRMLHNAKGSCKARTKGWHLAPTAQGVLTEPRERTGNQPCPAAGFPAQHLTQHVNRFPQITGATPRAAWALKLGFHTDLQLFYLFLIY